MEQSISVKQIAAFLKEKNLPFRLDGDPEKTVTGFSSLARYREGTLTWNNAKKEYAALPPHISVCVVQEGVQMAADAQIITPNSKAVFFSVLEHFWGSAPDDGLPAVGPGTVIGPQVQLGHHVRIGCNCTLVGDITIGDDTVIGDNVVIRNRVRIGSRCTIQSLVTIGEDGYGYSEDEDHVKTMIKHFGGVTIGNDVFIGNLTSVIRGTIDDTVIGSGTKISPATAVSHNNIIGENASLIYASLCGSVTVGENAYVSSCIVRNQVQIGQNAIVGIGSVVTKDVEDNNIVIGAPAKVLRENSGNENL